MQTANGTVIMGLGSDKVLAVIPARGGSKGIPRKNMVHLGGRPLIYWTINAALKSGFVDEIVVSSDDMTTIDFAKSLGCSVPFIRSPLLSNDSASGIDVLLDAVERCAGFDIVVYLQPTSPFRSATHIDEAMNLMENEQAQQCVSVVQHDTPIQWLKKITSEGRLVPYLPGEIPANRQQTEVTFVPNGALYISRVPFLKIKRTLFSEDTLAYVMSRKASVDIDSYDDLQIAKLYMAEDEI